MDKADRAAFLANLVEELSLPEGLKVVRSISPRLRRDFLLELPIELALQVVSFVSETTAQLAESDSLSLRSTIPQILVVHLRCPVIGIG